MQAEGMQQPTGHWCPVLIVDDDDGIRDALRNLLEVECFPVLEAHDGAHALDILAQTPAPVVILTDHHMPRLDGPGLIDFVKNTPTLNVRTAVVYMTAGNRILNPTLADQLAEFGVPVIRKPFDIDDIIRAVTQAQLGLDNCGREDERGELRPA
jgi:CheY-like chemotaxis protein